MCLSCGCGNPNENYGDSRHITMQDLDQAAQAAGITRDQVVQNILNTVHRCKGSRAVLANQQVRHLLLPSGRAEARYCRRAGVVTFPHSSLEHRAKSVYGQGRAKEDTRCLTYLPPLNLLWRG
jgi:hypothetical protein